MATQKQTYRITVDASPEKLWQILWNDETYRQWTSAFAPGSCAKSDWAEGSKILFVDDKDSGMVSRIARKIPNEFMSFEHLGIVKDGVEDTTSEQVKNWAGATENYTLTAKGNSTELLIELDIDDQHREYFAETWPKALDMIKSIAEGRSENVSA